MKLTRNFDLLQMFAEGGGDGGASAGSEGSVLPGAETGGDDPFVNAPKKAKELYAKMRAEREGDVPASAEAASAQVTTAKEEAPGATAAKKPTFKELIASEDYKADYERHIQKALKDRTKRHDTEMGEVNEILSLVGQKYGLDIESEGFRAELTKALQNDDSVYEKYAEEHDMPLEEARTVVQLKQQLERANKAAEQRREMEAENRIIAALRKSAEETVAKYPDFDLEAAMQDERFRQLTRAWNGNTTLAYESLNHTVLVEEAERRAAAEATQAVANSVRANLSRPAEGGISSSNNTASAAPDFEAMDLGQLRAWAAKQNHRMRR
ncbi:MAG: hypothetical protein IJ002_03140 [Clostridia bacterium]|nr:hypothetical protein [Clostridia bacterium]MBQ8836487.1 hypothetical protein [Clostridia bacterium]